MNTDLEVIENYLTGQLPPDERVRFEATLRTDPAVADALAFYLLTKQVAQEQAREQRRAEDQAREQRRTELDALRYQNVPTRPLWSAPMRWAAAASVVVLLGSGWFFFRPTDSAVMASRLTDQYITAHFEQLPTMMEGGSSGSSTVDSIKTGVDLFNRGKFTQADALFQDVLTRQPDNDNALQYAGIVALRQGNYDKAIILFHRLSQNADLVSNPGLFYESLAQLKRGQPLDKEQAKKLLEQVIKGNLVGKVEAEKILNEL